MRHPPAIDLPDTVQDPPEWADPDADLAEAKAKAIAALQEWAAGINSELERKGVRGRITVTVNAEYL